MGHVGYLHADKHSRKKVTGTKLLDFWGQTQPGQG